MLKTLLIEDNLIYRSILKSVLLRRFDNLHIEESSGEHDVLNVVNVFDPGLIFMDIDLKCSVTGLDLTKVIKAEASEIFIVVLSHHDTSEYRDAAFQNGADFFLSKSCSLENIFDCVDSVFVN
jgi:DNA-binding NarL/FixJ family response regulator